MSYSVLFPVYRQDNPEWVRIAIESMLNQSVRTDDFVVVIDGPISEELQKLIDSYWDYGFFNIVQLENNVGLGRALASGVLLCKNEIIARMDADDYSLPDRCERQLNVMREEDVDVVGTNVNEFMDSIENVVSRVLLPEKHSDIVAYAKRRCPIRHPALMYKKSSVIGAGNYRDFRHMQDYNLAVNMIMKGFTFYNIQTPLVYMRITRDFYNRRGGWKQAKLVWKLKKGFHKQGFYGFGDFMISALGNFIVCLLPGILRELIYRKFLRK